MRRFVLAALCLALVGPTASARAAEVPGPGVLDPVADLVVPGQRVPLGDDTSIARWAHPGDTAPVRSAPKASARTVTKLHDLTEDGEPEVYLVLAGQLDDDGVPWLQVQLPMRPNGRTGWVPADALSSLQVVRTRLKIDRGARRATLTRAGKSVWTAQVGVGTATSPTPAGHFYVRERLKGDGAAYGPWAFGTSAYSQLSDWPKGGVVGIHGTDEPSLIPGAISHGCVRVRNAEITRLAKLMPIGTPIGIV